jgi:metal-responsive CopG/Arc/MetJ family transcriptional regulator
MKVAVSIPDDVFTEADHVAKRLGLSRSELYARALKRYLEQLRGDEVTAALNTVYGQRRAELDPILHHLQLRSLKREDW